MLAGMSYCLLSPPRAHAHIIMEGELQGRVGDQKAAPCEGLPRSTTPYVFAPGAIIKLAAMEAIPHDGYFRISFDDDGTDFVDPQSIAPINPDRYGPGKRCLGTPDDHCGESDFCSDDTVLWDHLDPHLGSDVTFGQVREWTLQLPEIECDHCTIQVMQVMEDPADDTHGPFDGENDLYYRCIDVVLKKGAGAGPGEVAGPATNTGLECAKANRTDAGSSSDARGASDAGTKSDAGVPRATASRDAATSMPAASRAAGSNMGSAKDAGGHADHDDVHPDAAAGDDGCSALAGGHGRRTQAHGGFALLLTALLVRRNRARADAARRAATQRA
ncbi:MAG: SCE4755 family polysaccharide monooxygenase-like protein [Polyangiales bacterium]